MNKQELVAKISEKSGLSTRDASKALAAMVETVKDTLKAGEKVTLVGFGTFEVRERGERTGRNPQTGESITIKASRLPAFKAGKGFKEELN